MDYRKYKYNLKPGIIKIFNLRVNFNFVNHCRISVKYICIGEYKVTITNIYRDGMKVNRGCVSPRID